MKLLLSLALLLLLSQADTHLKLTSSKPHYIPSAFTIASKSIQHHEGFRSTPYMDTNNQLSIGYGTQMRHGISKSMAKLWMENRLLTLENKLLIHRWYRQLNNTRKSIILDMAYNLGYIGILNFHHMIWRLDRHYYKAAANAMVESIWYRQVGRRGKYLVKLMRKGR